MLYFGHVGVRKVTIGANKCCKSQSRNGLIEHPFSVCACSQFVSASACFSRENCQFVFHCHSNEGSEISPDTATAKPNTDYLCISFSSAVPCEKINSRQAGEIVEKNQNPFIVFKYKGKTHFLFSNIKATALLVEIYICKTIPSFSVQHK